MFKRVAYRSLNSRQKEAFNFQKVSAVLADYGFTTIRLTSDWRGADFIAQHLDGSTFLKVQLKSRLTFENKYLKQGLFICFPHGEEWFLYPHDSLSDLDSYIQCFDCPLSHYELSTVSHPLRVCSRVDDAARLSAMGNNYARLGAICQAAVRSWPLQPASAE